MSEQAQPNSIRTCPECGASLATNAILCVACGYHLKLGHRLQTQIVAQTTTEPETTEADPNPYAPPRAMQSNSARLCLELTEADADWARVIVSDAEYMPWLLVACLCCCAIPVPFMLPYYAYRLSNWTKLDAKFAELHSPNSFSPHGQLASDFQDARIRLILGVIFGAVYYIVALVIALINLLELV
jgi:hypothetical protein